MNNNLKHSIDTDRLHPLKGQRYVISINHEAFPKALSNIPNPPLRLYVIGNLEALKDGLAIVGARKATPYGLSCAKRFATLAAKAGVVVISGGAFGCDSAAHRATIEAGGKTVVFLGGGCDEPYPVRNTNMYQEIIDCGGAIVSENPWHYGHFKHTFVRRNRLIAGLSRATLIVEAGIPSGTFTTADFALEANKEVLAVPGAITSAISAGCNKLILSGATPIIDDDSFYDFLHTTYGTLIPQNYDSIAKKNVNKGKKIGESKNPVVNAICAAPMTISELFELAKHHCGYENPNVWLSNKLVEAEMDGKIMKYPDGRYGSVC